MPTENHNPKQAKPHMSRLEEMNNIRSEIIDTGK